MAANGLAVVFEDPLLVGDIKSLSKLSNASSAWALLSVWLTIAATVVVAAYFNTWWVYLPAIVVIAARQHALGVFVHDATHYRLFTSRTLNDALCDLFCAFPIGLSTLGYRDDHMEHHRSTNTLSDPYYVLVTQIPSWQWPQTKGEAVRHLLLEVSGMNTFRNLRSMQPWTALGQWIRHRHDPLLKARCTIDLAATGLFWTVIAAVLTLTGGWYLFFLLWFLPGLTFYQLFNRLRTMAEHTYEMSTGESLVTNQVQGSSFERFCIAPFNVNYHIVHHLFPAVPFYRLPQVHQRLMRIPAYRDNARIYSSYFGSEGSIWGELVIDSPSIR